MNRFSFPLRNFLNQYGTDSYLPSPLGFFTDMVFPVVSIYSRGTNKYHLFVNIMDEIGHFDDISNTDKYTINMLTLLSFLTEMNDEEIDEFIAEVSSIEYIVYVGSLNISNIPK